jgi:hypothetical protein
MNRKARTYQMCLDTSTHGMYLSFRCTTSQVRAIFSFG